MNKTTKGSLAAGAAAVLLLGGAGSLAYWTAETSVDAGFITAGTLTLEGTDCVGWTYAANSASAGEAVELFVPGDKVTTTCTFTVGATGDNLQATISATDVAFNDNTTSQVLKPVTSYNLTGGVNPRKVVDGGLIDSRDQGATITATVVVNIPRGSEGDGNAAEAINANDIQGIDAALEDITIKLSQNNPVAVP